jgi:hypothetical protein
MNFKIIMIKMRLLVTGGTGFFGKALLRHQVSLVDSAVSEIVVLSRNKAKLRGQRVEPRHPDRIVYLSHRDPLLVWIRALIGGSANQGKKRTVNYLRPPMLRLSVSALATLVKESPRLLSTAEAKHLQISLEGDAEITDYDFDSHLRLLTTSISELLVDH